MNQETIGRLNKSECVVCGTPVPDYEPEYCCNGDACACYGLPIEPPLCSKECTDKIYKRQLNGGDRG